MKRLLLIDGNAIIHRAYHAYPPSFTDKEGNPTNAVYGFFAMLLKLLDEVKPTYLVICFDKGAPTFRMNMYAGYHANRPQMKDDLASQVPILHSAITAIGIPHFGIEGYEADDLLGTFSVLATKDNLETIIVTGDRDLLQLVNEHVRILMPLVGITKTIVYDENKVAEKFGVKPSQIIDYKALVGDTSDNYPGVTGVGPKTASELLKKYETFENLYKHINDLPPQLGGKLATDAEQASLAKRLATIHKDAPVHLVLKDCDVKKFNQEKFIQEFEKLGFTSLIKRLQLQTEDSKKKKQDNSVSKQLELL
jgi:DNA polymerase-1